MPNGENGDVKKGRRMMPSAPLEIAANANEDKSAAGNSRLSAQKLYDALTYFSNGFTKGFTKLKDPVIAVTLIFGLVCVVWMLSDRDGDLFFGCSFQDGCYAKMVGSSAQKDAEKRIEKPSDDSGKVPEQVPKSDSAK